MKPKTQTVVLGGGCFWCTEALFQRLKGVTQVTPGYAGGETSDPNYYQVCHGNTGHAEVIEVEFDEAIIPFPDLLRIFWGTHNPTTPNRQGHDIGSAYRSLILYTNEDQKKEAENIKNELENSGIFENKIVTEIKKLKKFYPAEEEHHNFYAKNPNKPYCQLVIEPKLNKFFEQYGDKAR